MKMPILNFFQILEDKRKHEEDATRLPTILHDPAVEDDASVDERDVPINLCGAVSLSQVKDLLMEWLTSSPGNLIQD